jgi:NDP-sugar pyrophosphorylase family protein
MQCVILPGGVGTHLWPVGAKSFRPLLPLAGVPFVHYQLSWLAGQGVTQVVYALPPTSPVRAFAGAGLPWGLNIEYVWAASDAAILRRIHDAGLMSEWFFALSARAFVPIDFRRMSAVFLQQHRPALLAVSCNRGLIPFGEVCLSGGVVQLYRKRRKGQAPPCPMSYSDTGLSLLRRVVIDQDVQPESSDELADLFHRLSLADRLAGVEIPGDPPAPFTPEIA